ncbi:hypothetical protein ABV540_003756 [Vibrio fluvialis]
MASRWYRQGTISVAFGSREVKGQGTGWISAPNKPLPGDMLLLNGIGYEIEEITDDESLLLFDVYNTGNDLVNKPYAAIRNASLNINSRLAAAVSQAINQKQVQLNEFNNWMVNTTAELVPFTDVIGNKIQVWPLPRIQAVADAIHKDAVDINAIQEKVDKAVNKAEALTEDLLKNDQTLDGNKSFVKLPSVVVGENGLPEPQKDNELTTVHYLKKVNSTTLAKFGDYDRRFASLATLKASEELKAGDYVATSEYWPDSGHGGAVYRITTLEAYRNEINKAEWTPDGFGDHALAGGVLVAILEHDGFYWASQIGLHAPCKTAEEAVAKNLDHAPDFTNMGAYLNKERFRAGVGVVLHIEHGDYYFNQTAFLPACVFLCGGADWAAPTQSVRFIPLKPKYGGLIENYVPRANVPEMLDEYVPNLLPGGTGYMKLTKDWISSDSALVDVYYEFDRKLMYKDTEEYAILGCEGKETFIRCTGDRSEWYAQIELNNGTIVEFPERPKMQATEGKHKLEQVGNVVTWSILGKPVSQINVDDNFTLNMFGNDGSNTRAFGNGIIQYITLQSPNESTNVYIEGFKRVPLETLPSDLVMPGELGAANLVGFEEGKEWFRKHKFDPNNRMGYMFIWNASMNENKRLVPIETVYVAPYVGGISSIEVNNYEEDFNPAAPYEKDYLKGISAAMIFGGGIFHHCVGNRVWTFAHRPEMESHDFYVDGWEVYNYKCNTPIENEAFQFDYNGTGDAVVFQGCQFPVNHPDDMYPQGEYPNGVVKAIKLQNSAFWQGQWTLSTVGASIGMQINRCINGLYAFHGVGSFQVNACHLEFGQVLARDSAGSVNDTYFSQITEVGRLYPEYPDIITANGEFPSSCRTVKLNNCEFHRGYDGAHMPATTYNIIASEVHNIEINNCYQGWDLSGSGVIEIAPTVGRSVQNPKDPTDIKYYPLEGWDRWSQYLARSSRILRGKIVPQMVYREVGGFGGIEDIFLLNSPTLDYWKAESDTTYYYQMQYMLDVGDRTERGNTKFKSMGLNPFIGYEADLTTPLETERSIYIPPAGTDWEGKPRVYRPSINTYSQIRTLSDGMIRLYRGTESKNYTHYVDIPALSLITIEDLGDQVYGRPWKQNPSAPGLIPMEDLRNDKRFQIYMAGGDGFFDENTGEASSDGVVTRYEVGAESKTQRVEIGAYQYFPADVLDDKETYIYVTGNTEPTQNLTVTLDNAAKVGSIVNVAVSTGSTAYSVVLQTGGDERQLAVVADGHFVRAEKIGSETSSKWFVTSTH